MTLFAGWHLRRVLADRRRVRLDHVGDLRFSHVDRPARISSEHPACHVLPISDHLDRDPVVCRVDELHVERRRPLRRLCLDVDHRVEPAHPAFANAVAIDPVWVLVPLCEPQSRPERRQENCGRNLTDSTANHWRRHHSAGIVRVRDDSEPYLQAIVLRN